ncbi:hypothetical protein GmHk_07G019076 [Glycine max]|nr:hypothetical protein GmHk_07G019076 [Glycine max]
MTTLAQRWSFLSYFNLAPTSHTSDLNMDKARLIYGIIMKMDMDSGNPSMVFLGTKRTQGRAIQEVPIAPQPVAIPPCPIPPP